MKRYDDGSWFGFSNQIFPAGSPMNGQFYRRSQRKIRRDARRLGTTVAKLKK